MPPVTSGICWRPTNDHWTQLPNIQPPDSNKDSYERKEAGDKAMMEFGKDKMSPDTLFQVLSTKPVYNESTLYTAVMSAADSSVFSAWIYSLNQIQTGQGTLV